jgi:hypothetical protein
MQGGAVIRPSFDLRGNWRTVVTEDKRRWDRRRLFLRGFVRFSKNNTTVDCIVRDISERGARLSFKHALPIPETIELHIPSKGQIVQSKLAWVDNCEAGISFESPVALDSPSPVDSEVFVRMARLEDEISALKQMLKHLQDRLDQSKAA